MMFSIFVYEKEDGSCEVKITNDLLYFHKPHLTELTFQNILKANSFIEDLCKNQDCEISNVIYKSNPLKQFLNTFVTNKAC